MKIEKITVHVCPICYEEYESEDEAQECLEECKDQEVDEQTRYVCPYCKDTHFELDEAEQCYCPGNQKTKEKRG